MPFAVHLPDGPLSNVWLAAGWVMAAGLIAIGVRRISEDEVPRIGLLTAALFVATLLHVPIGVGRVHLLLNAVAGILLGRRVGVAVFVALTFQFFLFTHGGLTTLGLNTAVIGLPAFAAAGLLAIVRGRVGRRPSLAFPVGAVLGLLVSLTTVALNGLVIWFGMEDGGRAAAVTVVALHVPVIAAECLGTGVVVAYLAKVKPEWLNLRPASRAA